MLVDIDIRDVTRSFGAHRAVADASLQVHRGELVSVLGTSGSGKSTLLNLIAGHLRPDSGTIEVGGRVVAGGRTWVGPEGRDVGMVFQDYALFPHLTVAGNVAFAVRRKRRLALRSGREREALVAGVLERLGLTELARRFPHELSGGQQQRVAIARALAQQPRMLLLDEPFSNLDAGTREHVRSEIVALLRETGLTCVFVTHDQEEALAISDRVAVMQSGRIMQVDEPEALYRRPFCLEVASFLGKTNVLSGVATGDRVATEIGEFRLPHEASGKVRILVRPELLEVRPCADGMATVVAREFRGHDVLYTLRLDGGRKIWAHRPSVAMAAIGDRVSIEPQAGQVSLYVPSANAGETGDADADTPEGHLLPPQLWGVAPLAAQPTGG